MACRCEVRKDVYVYGRWRFIREGAPILRPYIYEALSRLDRLGNGTFLEFACIQSTRQDINVFRHLKNGGYIEPILPPGRSIGTGLDKWRLTEHGKRALRNSARPVSN